MQAVPVSWFVLSEWLKILICTMMQVHLKQLGHCMGTAVDKW